MNSRPPRTPASSPNSAIKNDDGATMGTNQLNAASMDWMKSPNASHLVTECTAELDWDDGLAQRVLVEYVRFCHLKVLHKDERAQQIVPPDLVGNMWEVHYADFVRYEMDMRACFGVGTFLWFNVPMLLEHCTVAERIEQTKAAVLAVYGPGGYDDDVWSEHSQLLRYIDESKAAIKNKLNTNADPLLCACCSAPLLGKLDDVMIHLCCGKQMCKSCEGTTYNAAMDQCLLCGISGITGIGALKKNAKRYRPWAQFFFAESYKRGDQVTQSPYDAMRWYRKANSNGHPGAAVVIAEMLCGGVGCKRDVPKAVEFANRARALDPFNSDSSDAHLVRVTHDMIVEGKVKEAASFLPPSQKFADLIMPGTNGLI